MQLHTRHLVDVAHRVEFRFRDVLEAGARTCRAHRFTVRQKRYGAEEMYDVATEGVLEYTAIPHVKRMWPNTMTCGLPE